MSAARPWPVLRTRPVLCLASALAFCAAGAPCGARAAVTGSAAAVPTLQALPAPAIGWRLGDVLERELHLQLPPGWQLRADSLPVPRPDGRALELRALVREPMPGGERLRLRYQVMRAPQQVAVWETPPWRLALQGPTRLETLRVEAWPVVVAPLLPPATVHREGLGEWRPDRPPPLPDTALRTAPLALALALALAAAGLLLRVWAGRWWRPGGLRGGDRPLARAWRSLRRLPVGAAHPGAEAAGHSALVPALRRLHAALDQRHGRVLRPAALADFCAAAPPFAPLLPELQRFFALSDAVFFGTPTPADTGAAWLRGLARRLRDAERRC